MTFLKHLPLIAFMALTVLGAEAGAVQSYKEWKNCRVQEAQQRVSVLKTQIDSKKNSRRDIAQGKDPNLAMKTGTEANMPEVQLLERQLRQEADNLDIAKDLTVSDYFAGYLTKVKDQKAAFNEVAGKLSAEEVAELMSAYANSVFGARGSDLPTTATAVSRESMK